VQDVTITTTSSVWNALIAPFHGLILSLVKGQLPQVNTFV